MIATIIGAILIFSVIIFVHEFGHFITARIFGVTVHEFAIGMGPAIFKKQGKTTLYSIRAIPMGGFCSLEGEDQESSSPNAFNNKKPLPRIIILAAGATMNILLGFIVLVFLTTSSAFTNGGIASTYVESVMPESNAAEFLMPGDRIVAINGNKINIYRDLGFEVSSAGDRDLELTFERDGKKITKTVAPIVKERQNGTKGYLIGFNVAKKDISLGGILHESFFQTIWMFKIVFLSLGMLFGGQAGLKDLSGPVGVVSTLSTVAESGILNLLFFAAFLSVNIGIMNLMPLPALDGGRILFVLIELIFRKPIPREKEGLVHFVGLALLVILMLYATYNDVLRLFP